MNNYVATKEDIKRTIDDFDLFCSYLEEKKPKLTKTRKELGKKDCFAINAMLSRPRGLDGPKYLQNIYPTINLFFHVVMETGFFSIKYTGRGESFLAAAPALEIYRSLNDFNKYMLLFKTYWTRLDFNQLYFDSLAMLNHFMYTKLAFEKLAAARPGVRIFADVENFRYGFDRTDPVHHLFVGAGLVVRHLMDFGFWEYEEAYIPELLVSKKDIAVKAVTPNAFGLAMINACRTRPYEIYNIRRDNMQINMSWLNVHTSPLIEKLGLKKLTPVKNNEPFEKAFGNIFPSGTVDPTAIDLAMKGNHKNTEPPQSGPQSGNVYIFKVSLDRGVWRRIEMSASNTLHHLHQSILDAFDFDDDHLYAFFMDGKPWSQNAYWDKRDGQKPRADQAVIGKIGLEKGQSLLYLFDFGFEWRFKVKVEDILHSETPPPGPVITKKKGDAPKQYPGWGDYEG